MKKYRHAWMVAGGTLVLALSACGSGGAAADDDTIRIGYIGGASGFSAAFGVPTRQGVEAAAEDINDDGGILGRKVEIVVADDKGDPNASQTAMRRLASDGIQFVVSGSSSAATLAHQGVAASNEVLVVSPIGSDPAIVENQEGTPWYFVNVPSNDQLGEAVAQHAVDDPAIESVAVFERDDAYGVSTSEGFTETAEPGGLTITDVITYAVDKKEFGSDLVKALGKNPDAIFLSGYAEDSGLIAKQARAAGFSGALLGTSPMTADQYVEVAGSSAADGTFVSTASALLVESNADAEQLEFAEVWTEENGTRPNDYQLAAYDSLYALKHAIESADSVDPTKARDALLDVEFDGVSGLVGFDDQGASRRPVYVVERSSDGWVAPATS
jgi:branched-chain amino acid transport system substrate-binding protein